MRQKSKLFSLLALAMLVFSACGSKENEVVINSEADLAGLKVGTIAGSIYDIQLSAREDISLHLFSSTSDCVEALKSGKVDALLMDEVVFSKADLKRLGFKRGYQLDEGIPSAFAFQKGDSSLVKSFNAFLKEFKESGGLAATKDYWMETEVLRPEDFPKVEEYTTGEPLRFGNSEVLAPIAFYENGVWNGFEIELVRRFAAYMHRPVKIELMEFASLIVSLQMGKSDFIGGCISVTEERKMQVDFSDPFYDVHPVYFVRDAEAISAKSSSWEGLVNSFRQAFIVENRWKILADGLLTTLKITFWAIVLGSLLGIVLCEMGASRRKWMRRFVSLYDAFMYGIPMLVLLLIMFYVVFSKAGLSGATIAIIAFALNFASASGGVFRTAVHSVPPGQMEAALALGFTKARAFIKIVIPQAVRVGLPLFRGECISLLKGTSIVGYIAIIDVTRASDLLRSRTFDAFFPLLAVTVIYFVLAWLIGFVLNLLNKSSK